MLAAPYHRMSWGMKAARAALSANADDGTAEAKVRALGVNYVLECPAHHNRTDRSGMAATSLQKRLDKQGDPPAWLERVNAPKSVLDVYRVRPPSATGAERSAGRPGRGYNAGSPMSDTPSVFRRAARWLSHPDTLLWELSAVSPGSCCCPTS